ncbi:hypothetical protein Ngar_c32400 [Candidatus Nitrososphaera gargensis Ga9.2]|uniref:Uncharacterized protein n=1 Tax=Nitrososphaera gargensis (strain Ga9.2) TaxID=1237085 RepID=K0IFL8_NITGG|nr:hypothetical protein Ngar_c32400 [Candidatus Nitrososphaera gargensis Ga9.2]
MQKKGRLQQAACVELVQVVLSIFAHGSRQDAVHVISG